MHIYLTNKNEEACTLLYCIDVVITLPQWKVKKRKKKLLQYMFQAFLIIIFSVMLITPYFLHELVKIKVLFDTKMKYIILHMSTF